MKKYCEECGRLFDSVDLTKIVCDDCIRDNESFDDIHYFNIQKLEDQQQPIADDNCND